MKIHNKYNAIFTVILALVIGLACGSANQQAEANKLVDQANKTLDETKELYSRTEARNNVLFNVNIQTMLQLQYYKAKMDGEAKSIVADYEKIAEKLKEISGQYDEVSRMNLDEKFKEYARLKSDEFAKRAEAIVVRKGNTQAFTEIDDPKIMMARFKENNLRSDKLFADAVEISEKAKKIEEDHKEIFRQA